MGVEHKITAVFHLSALLVIILYLLMDAVPRYYALIAVAFFVIKGVSFAIIKQNPVSALDAVAGAYLFLPVIGWFTNIILNIIFIAFLVQKGISYIFR